jgi:hypothetical protein
MVTNQPAATAGDFRKRDRLNPMRMIIADPVARDEKGL